jgi:hypothetical protein
LGSGPVPGVIEVSHRVQSIKTLLNYFPRGGGVEFIFDPKKNIFIVGRPKNPTAFNLTGSPHEQLARSIGADESVVLGGIFQRKSDGSIITTEASGHFWQNWTPEMRKKFVKEMNRMGMTITHLEGH